MIIKWSKTKKGKTYVSKNIIKMFVVHTVDYSEGKEMKINRESKYYVNEQLPLPIKENFRKMVY